MLNHLQIADKFNYIPFVDMENFPSWYNEKDKIKNTFNSWEYYFSKVSKYSLKDVVELISKKEKISKKIVYEICLEIKNDKKNN